MNLSIKEKIFFHLKHYIKSLVKFKPTIYLFGEDSIFAPHSFELIIEVAENLTGKNPLGYNAGK